jgi:hypothetical protein
MVITVRYKTWRGVDPLHKHELLKQAMLKLTFWFPDGHQEVLPLTWNDAKLEWRASTTASHVNAVAMEFDYSAVVPWQGSSYEILRILQDFTLVALPATVPPVNDRAAAPSGWVFVKPGGARVMRTIPLGLHPLLEFSGPLAPVLTINALMTDVTELWDAMHGAHRPVKLRKALLDPVKTKLRILAHLGGIPFVWFASIPKAAEESNEVSPHVFYMPDDFGGVEYDPKSIAGLASSEHDNGTGGGRVVNNYMLDPIDDDQYTRISPNVPDDGLPNRAKLFRNVANVDAHPANDIRPMFWNIPMGMSRAVHGSNAKQVLLIPLRRAGFSLERAQTAALQDMVEAAMKVLWTQSESIALTYSKPLTIGKYVLSGFSDGGVALWDGAMMNLPRLKGVIAVEPQNMNSAVNAGGSFLGKDVIAKLVENNVRVVLIGRHKMGNYNPQVSTSVQSKIVKLPDDTSGVDTDGLEKVSYDVVFTYPPDISKNHFMIYRTYRLWEPDKDFLLRADNESKQLLAAAKASALKGKKVPAPVTYQELINKIFFPSLIQDTPGNFYHHHFALNGGRKLKLPPMNANEAYYKVAVQYKTMFQEALETIG